MKPKPVNLDALDVVREGIEADPRFGYLREHRNRFVPGEGNYPLCMIVGEAPGAQEALKLRPFVGVSGKVLRTLMVAAGLHSIWIGKQTGLPVIPGCEEGVPPNCWLTNVLKYRPPMNRTPSLAEIVLSRPYLRAEWMAVGGPKVIVPVGAAALSAIMPEADMSITKVTGQFIKTKLRPVPGRYQDGKTEVTVVPMLHPRFLLHGGDGAIKRAAKDWERLGEYINAHD